MRFYELTLVIYVSPDQYFLTIGDFLGSMTWRSLLTLM